jgi:hypothetical protein
MPRLACYSCGRQIYTVAPLESLFAEERRCPRCGAFLNGDRREDERRTAHRRQNPEDDPGPPKAAGAALETSVDAAPQASDRRLDWDRGRGLGPADPPAAGHAGAQRAESASSLAAARRGGS